LEDEEADLSKEDIDANIAILKKIENIRRGVSLYQRETGVNPLYLAFPLLIAKGARHRNQACPERCRAGFCLASHTRNESLATR
jgi:hypothetical protein